MTRPPDLTRVSPELALIDPELARRLRHRVPRKRPGHRPPLPVLRLPAGSTPRSDSGHDPTDY